MTIGDKLNAMRYDLIAPKEDALLNESKNLDEKISDTSPLQKAVSKLSAKIQESKTWEERYVLEKQLNELEEIYILYQKYERKNVTNKTKLELNNLFEWITKQINLKENTINDDNEKIEELLEKEEERLEDTIDLIGNLTIRDIVEKYIDIDWVMESLSPKEYQEFFDIFTITYINHLDKNKDKKQDKEIIENDWFYLDNNDALDFIHSLIKNINSNNSKINTNFNFTIKLNKDWYEKTLDANLKIIEKELEEFEEKNNTKIKETKSKKIISKKPHYNNWVEKKTTLKRMKDIETLLDNDNINPFLESVVKKFEWKTIYLWKNKKIELDEKYINQNKEKIYENLKTLVLLIIEIESDWNPKAKNKYSSASWLWQWLVWNWKNNTEYMYNWKWYPREKKGEKNDWKRKVWLTSSFETILKNIKHKYPDNVIAKIDFMPDNFKEKTNINPLTLTIEEQLTILILDLWSNNKTIKNILWEKVWINEYLWKALLWDEIAMQKIYKKFHHTAPTENTLKRINNIIPKYRQQLIALK